MCDSFSLSAFRCVSTVRTAGVSLLFVSLPFLCLSSADEVAAIAAGQTAAEDLKGGARWPGERLATAVCGGGRAGRGGVNTESREDKHAAPVH